MGGAVAMDGAVAAARAGDESGFAVLWQTLHPPLLRYLTVRGDESPEDLAAETWLQVVRGLPAFVGGASDFRAWLFTIARHRAIDQGRARGRRPVTVELVDPDPPGVAGPSAEDVVVDRETTARALRLVATLPAAQAEMVMLRVVAGLEVADVARLVGKRPGTVRVTVHRALRSLAEHPSLHAASATGTTRDTRKAV